MCAQLPIVCDILLFPGNFSLTECWVPPMCGELKTWPGFHKHDNLTCLSFPFLKSKTDQLSHLANQDRSAASHWFWNIRPGTEVRGRQWRTCQVRYAFTDSTYSFFNTGSWLCWEVGREIEFWAVVPLGLWPTSLFLLPLHLFSVCETKLFPFGRMMNLLPVDIVQEYILRMGRLWWSVSRRTAGSVAGTFLQTVASRINNHWHC